MITKAVKRTLFQRGNGYPAKKVLTFNRYSDDFPFQVFYGDLDFLSTEELRCVCVCACMCVCVCACMHACMKKRKF